jgi:hypothetical protein
MDYGLFGIIWDYTGSRRIITKWDSVSKIAVFGWYSHFQTHPNGGEMVFKMGLIISVWVVEIS